MLGKHLGRGRGPRLLVGPVYGVKGPFFSNVSFVFLERPLRVLRWLLGDRLTRRTLAARNSEAKVINTPSPSLNN
jgi:hypothetical protein